jgi:hypothetical protein
MLKLTLLKTGLKAGLKFCFKNFKSGVITFIVGFVIFLFIQDRLNHRAIVQELKGQKTNLQKMAFLEAKKDSLASIALAKENARLKGLYKAQSKYTLEWKEKALDLQVEQELLSMGRIKVSFRKDNEYLFLKGYTLTETEEDSAEAKLEELRIKPFTIEDDYMTVGDDVYHIITPSDPHLEIKNHISLIPPEYRKSGSCGIPWKWILPAVGIGYLAGKVFN